MPMSRPGLNWNKQACNEQGRWAGHGGVRQGELPTHNALRANTGANMKSKKMPAAAGMGDGDAAKVDGKAGVDGIDGIDGIDGAAGVDGGANGGFSQDSLQIAAQPAMDEIDPNDRGMPGISAR